MQLRDYQTECIETMKKHFETSNKQIIQMPTGAGKTVTFMKYLADNSKKSIIVVPTRELLEQVFESGLNFMHNSQIFAKENSLLYLKDHNILTASSLNYESTSKKLLDFQADIIIVDEAHRAQSDTYRNFISKYLLQYPKTKIAGFTATPERRDKLPLLDIFEKLTFQRNIYDLVKLGHLCDMESYRIKTGQKFDTRKINDVDFAPVALKNLDNDTRNELILKTYRENCENKKTLVFCVSVEHAERLAKSFKLAGYKAEAIHGDLFKGERKSIIDNFRKGRTNILFNCQLLTEGFDEPSIEALIIARPTKSKSLYCQMIGRGLRNYPGKEVCYLYELTDNVHNICTFNVAAEKDCEYEYKNGIRLTHLKETLEGISLKDIHLVKEKINLYTNENAYLACETATDFQIKLLMRFGIRHMEPLSFLEASFLIWKHNFKEKYGKN